MNQNRLVEMTKEAVTLELSRTGNSVTAAGVIVHRMLAASFGGGFLAQAKPDFLIEGTVKGAMAALLVAELDLAGGALGVMDSVVRISAAFELDPTDSMRSVLCALADLRRFLPMTRIIALRHAIDGRYMGAGEAFIEYANRPLEAGGELMYGDMRRRAPDARSGASRFFRLFGTK